MRITLTASLLLMAGASTAPARAATQHQLLVPAVAFRGEDGYQYGYNSSDGYVWSGQQGSPGCIVAPVELVSGTRITDLSADIYDNLPTNFTLQLRRHTVVDPAAASEVLAELVTSGASTSIHRLTTAAISNGSVDAYDYSYYLTTASGCLATDSGEHRIYAARISYDGFIFSDGFESGNTSAWTSNVVPRLMIPGAGFFTAKNGQESPYYYFDSGAGFFSPSMPSKCYAAPVRLPDGATVWLLEADVWDNTSPANLTLTLRRKQYSIATGSEAIAVVATAGAGTGMQWLVAYPTQPVIDNSLFEYYLEFCTESTYPLFTTSHRIYGVRFDYTP